MPYSLTLFYSTVSYPRLNVHAPNNDIQERFRCLEFIGEPMHTHGRTLYRGRHRTLHVTLYYSLEEDFAWFGNLDSLPDKLMEKCI